MGESNDTIKGGQKLGQGAHEGRKYNKRVHECGALNNQWVNICISSAFHNGLNRE